MRVGGRDSQGGSGLLPLAEGEGGRLVGIHRGCSPGRGYGQVQVRGPEL